MTVLRSTQRLVFFTILILATPAILRQHHCIGSSGNLGAKVGRCPWGLNLIQHKEKSIREINADLVANCLISRELRNQNKYSKKTYKKVIHKKNPQI